MTVLIFPTPEETRDLRFNKFERSILRDMANTYLEEMGKKAKGLKKMGISTSEIDQRAAAINGTDGYGHGIYARLHEIGSPVEVQGSQLPLGHAADEDEDEDEEEDEARAAERAEQRLIFEQHCTEVRDGLLGQELFPSGQYAEHLLRIVQSWQPEQRADAMAWVQRETAAPAPDHVLTALDRVREGLLSPDEVARYSEAGPWELDADVWEGTETRFYRAMAIGDSAEEGGRLPTSYDPATFDNEGDALRRVAWLNKEDEARWLAEPQREDVIETGGKIIDLVEALRDATTEGA